MIRPPMPHNSNTPVESGRTQSDDYLAEARACFDNGDVAGAVTLLDLLFASNHCPAGSFYLRSLCYYRASFPLESLQAVEAELVLNPHYPGAAEHYEMLRQRTSTPGSDVPSARPWTTALDKKMIQHMEHCSHLYKYRSVPMSKNAFDFALYPMLLWQIKPRTIIEVGSFYGGSAMWMADMTQAWGARYKNLLRGYQQSLDRPA